MVETSKEEGNYKASLLSYACRKVRDHEAVILFNLVCIHNFISTKLASNQGVHDFDM